jgi:hypothetical protein
MYAAVPSSVPACVPTVVTVGASALTSSGARIFAMPKSSTFTVPSGVTLMLAGFRSR